jgi:hypothetical protein
MAHPGKGVEKWGPHKTDDHSENRKPKGLRIVESHFSQKREKWGTRL